MAKVVTVFGATGHQGGAVARALALDPSFKVRAVTRGDSQSEKAQNLLSCGAEVMTCNFNDVTSIKQTLAGADACFVVTYSDFSNADCIEEELKIGRNFAKACAASGVKHILYGTQLNTLNIIGIAARHLVAKAQIQEYFMEENLPMTYILVPCYYENLLDYLKPEKIDNKNFRLAIPMGTTPLDMVCVEDIGEIAKLVFKNKEKFLNKTLSVAGDKITVKEMAATLSRHLAPMNFKDRQITLTEYRSLPYPWAKDFANMFDFFLRVDQRYNVQYTKQNYNPKMKTFSDWVQANIEKLRQEFNK
ncbi:hypothetical protein ACJMK2_038541 [Sinanodonta woodiana]|uniref:NmrA-like family domain-containing protein 1 n=1 Tax=Sinanodonta woodiana TaxID=1069815 RepID=A0ABD3W9B0_SINWO